MFVLFMHKKTKNSNKLLVIFHFLNFFTILFCAFRRGPSVSSHKLNFVIITMIQYLKKYLLTYSSVYTIMFITTQASTYVNSFCRYVFLFISIGINHFIRSFLLLTLNISLYYADTYIAKQGTSVLGL